MWHGCVARTIRASRALIAALGGILALTAGGMAEEACSPDVVDLRTTSGSLRFQVEVMDDDAERARGLMEREALSRFSGMLFVYPQAGPVAFWMRNTLIPLDMLFFDSTGRLEQVHANARPLDETPIFGGTNIRYVLEINGGAARRLGIAPGAELRHPALDRATAAWPCPD